MVQKIKRRTKGGPGEVRLVPLVLALSALTGPQRRGRDVRRPFSPAWRLREVFLDHFDLDVVTTDRPLSVEEYARWQGATDPAWVVRSAGEPHVVLTKAPAEYDDDAIGAGLIPMVVQIDRARLDELASLWTTELPEVARVALTGVFTDSLNLIPGYDRVMTCGPRPAREANHLLGQLAMLIRDECAAGGVDAPLAFPSCPERVLAAGPVSVKR